MGKDATLEISGRIGKGEFEFGAKFSGTIPINSDGSLVIQSIELKLELSGKKSSVKLECTLYWNIPESLGSSQVQFIGEYEFSGPVFTQRLGFCILFPMKITYK